MFDTGLCMIYHLTDAPSANGMMPKKALQLDVTCYYGERTVSYNRYYAAQGANASISKLIRVPFDITVATGQYVVLEDGDQYRIDAVSDVIVKSNKRARELTLVRLDDHYDVAEEEEEETTPQTPGETPGENGGGS